MYEIEDTVFSSEISSKAEESPQQGSGKKMNLIRKQHAKTPAKDKTNSRISSCQPSQEKGVGGKGKEKISKDDEAVENATEYFRADKFNLIDVSEDRTNTSHRTRQHVREESIKNPKTP